MPYQHFISGTTTLAVLPSYLTLPGVLNRGRSNPQNASMTTHPDTTFTLLSQCKRKVTDAARCYNACSATVALASPHNC